MSFTLSPNDVFAGMPLVRKWAEGMRFCIVMHRCGRVRWDVLRQHRLLVIGSPTDAWRFAELLAAYCHMLLMPAACVRDEDGCPALQVTFAAADTEQLHSGWRLLFIHHLDSVPEADVPYLTERLEQATETERTILLGACEAVEHIDPALRGVWRTQLPLRIH